MRHPESELQKQCVTWFRYCFPGRIIFHVPNGGKRNKLEAIRLKQEGVLAGIPDLCIPEPSKDYHGAFIELKAGKNSLTDTQREQILKLKDRGYFVEVCRSLDEFIQITGQYLIL